MSSASHPLRSHPLLRCSAGAASVAALTYAGTLGWVKPDTGVAVAAASAVAVVAGLFALSGVVPTNIKFGDVQVALQRERDLGKEEGKKEEGLVGLQEGLKLAASLATGQMPPEEVTRRLEIALHTDQPMVVDGSSVAVPKLAPGEVREHIEVVEQAISTIVNPLENPVDQKQAAA